MRIIIGLFVLCVLGTFGLGVTPAEAQYGRTPDSDFNPTNLSIDDAKYLGVRVDRDLRLVDHEGTPFKLGDLFGKPLIIVMSYYQCDGTCSVVNQDLKAMIDGMSSNDIGKDYRVLTITFDKNDTLETLREFRGKMAFADELAGGWTWSMAENKEDIKPFTEKMGFKFFWSPRDRLFFHPGVFIVLSPQGRVTRYLYALSNAPRDVDIALLEARSEQMRPTPKELINYAVSLCYSYNFQEGRYTINYGLFIAIGSLFVGVGSLAVAMFVFRQRRGREASQ